MSIAFQTFKRTALAVALAAAALTGHAKDFRSADVHPNDYPTVVAVGQMGKSLAEQTKGRLGVKVFANSSMGSEKDTVEQVKIGALEVVSEAIPETPIAEDSSLDKRLDWRFLDLRRPEANLIFQPSGSTATARVGATPASSLASPWAGSSTRTVGEAGSSTSARARTSPISAGRRRGAGVRGLRSWELSTTSIGAVRPPAEAFGR